MEISKRYYWHLFISISCSLSNKLNLPSFISRELKTSLKSGLTISKVDVYIRAIFSCTPQSSTIYMASLMLETGLGGGANDASILVEIFSAAVSIFEHVLLYN